MKALSLSQPWALLPFAPPPFRKQYETRGWYTSYRGPLVIHASGRASFDKQNIAALCHREPFRRALLRLGVGAVDNLPFGAVVGVVELVACIGTSSMQGLNIIDKLSPVELAFGDFSSGRFMWQLANPRRLAVPVPCRGALNLWEVPAAVLAAALTPATTGEEER